MSTRRQPPRLSVIFQKYDPPVYFVTACCAERKRLLANEAVHEAFREFAVRGHRDRGIAVGRYVLMPDHLHVFVCGPAEFRLGEWVRLLKTKLRKAFAPRKGFGVKSAGETPEYWQRGFFDHVVRHSESYAEKWEYVRQNPVRAGLVARAEDWPYQGEVVAIDRV